MSSDLQCIIQPRPDTVGYYHNTYAASTGYGDGWGSITLFFGTLEAAIRWHNKNCESEYGLTIDIPDTEDEVTTEVQQALDIDIPARTFARISFKVEAIRVDKDNLENVANWCGGRVSHTKEGVPFVEIPTGSNPKVNRNRAFVGYWVVTGKNGTYFSYSDRAFKNTFEEIWEK